MGNQNTDMVIRSAGLDDATQISAFVTGIAQEHIAPTLSDDGLRYLLSGMALEPMRQRLTEGFKFFVAQDGTEMIGIAAIRLPSHLYYLFVGTAHQRTGIGRKLFQHVQNCAIEFSSNRQITVNSSLNAVAAYERMGFRISGPIEELQDVRYQPMCWEEPPV